MESFYRLTLFGVEEEAYERVSQLCFEWSALGIEEQVSASAFVEASGLTTNLTIYFAHAPEAEFYSQLRAITANLRCEGSVETSRDWLAEWKESFSPFVLKEPYWIVPSWCDLPNEATVALRMDPGMAFGTGTHETTKMAAALLLGRAHGRTVLDVGTGTGILAMVASLEGSSRVLAIDHDPEALRVCRENVEKNHLGSIEICDTPIERIGEKFDLVVANIVENTLRELKSYLVNAVQTNGHLILSGLLVADGEVFLKEFMAGTSLKLVEQQECGEWVSYCLQKGRG